MGEYAGQKELFSYGVDLDRRVHADHPLRRVRAMIDYTFALAAVANTYGDNGNLSVDPAKMMFLLFERRLSPKPRETGRFGGFADAEIRTKLAKCLTGYFPKLLISMRMPSIVKRSDFSSDFVLKWSGR